MAEKEALLAELRLEDALTHVDRRGEGEVHHDQQAHHVHHVRALLLRHAARQQVVQDRHGALAGRVADHHHDEGARVGDGVDHRLVRTVAVAAEAQRQYGALHALVRVLREALQTGDHLSVAVGEVHQTALRDGGGVDLNRGNEEGGNDGGVLLQEGEEAVDVFGLIIGRCLQQRVDDGRVDGEERVVLLLVFLEWRGVAMDTQMD